MPATHREGARASLDRLLKNPLFSRLLKEARMQGGARAAGAQASYFLKCAIPEKGSRVHRSCAGPNGRRAERPPRASAVDGAPRSPVA